VILTNQVSGVRCQASEFSGQKTTGKMGISLEDEMII
jgi:hypothetical protein